MRIAVLANDAQWKELITGANEEDIVRINELKQGGDTADAYIVLEPINIEQLNWLQKPVLLNSVIQTSAILHTGTNLLRINGWSGFLSRNTWELAGTVTSEVKEIFTTLNKQYIQVADEPGLIAARTISMIINEAYFALGESVSTKAAIDIAMKLGTNYPFGPFEWAEKIGVHHICQLLLVLSKTDTRYLPAPLLHKETTT